MKKPASRPKKKTALRSGDHVVTNGMYAAITGMCHEGTLIAPQRWSEGLWTVRAHHPVLCLRPQLIHQTMMEKWSEEHVGTITKEKPVKLAGLVWQKTNRDQWVCEAAEARIRQLDASTYSVSRGGRYLGSEKSLEAAADRAKANRLSDRNEHLRQWERDRPTELPPGLSAVERAEWVRRHPGAESREPGGRAPRDPVRAKVRADVAARAKPAAKASGERGARDAELLTLLARGCTREEILRVTGWKAVSVQQMARTLGVGLRVETGSKPYRYFSTEEVS